LKRLIPTLLLLCILLNNLINFIGIYMKLAMKAFSQVKQSHSVHVEKIAAAGAA
jgi:hypothetical protein